MKLAVVGGGPRMVFALEELVACAAPVTDVFIYEPRAELGVGSAYATDQPDWLRINVAADAILQTSILGMSFEQWRQQYDGLDGTDKYPPRALVGRFLVESADEVIARLPKVEHVASQVVDVWPDGDCWVVATATSTERVDAVLLVTGHDRSGGESWGAPPYPPAWPMGASDRVAVRGGALTAIDVTLGCTEGRGGTFRRDGSGSLIFEPGSQTPRSIVWWTRTGTLMSTKSDLSPTIRATLADAVADAVGDLRGDTRDHVSAAADAICDAVSATTQPRPEQGTTARLAHDIWVARGAAQYDREWALGQAWRLVYPALVRRHRRWQTSGGAPVEGWRAFADLATAMERRAFGPPLVNAEKMLALMQAGVLRTTTGAPPPADLRIDAVLAPPGVRQSRESLWRALAARGLIHTPQGRRGVLTDVDGTVVVDGVRREGLAVLGRATEDVVLGNDTLSRTAHPHIRWWAQALGRTEVAR